MESGRGILDYLDGAPRQPVQSLHRHRAEVAADAAETAVAHAGDEARDGDSKIKTSKKTLRVVIFLPLYMVL